MLSPEAEFLKGQIRSLERPSAQPIEDQRADWEKASAEGRAMLPLPPDTVTDALDIDGVRVERVAVGKSDPDRAVLLLHGGGFVSGSVNTHRGLAAQLAKASGAVVWTVDYRLAPEHPYPAGLDDALVTYLELISRYGASRTSVVGDSAGGGLALTLLIEMRERGLPAPVAAALLSPWVDLSCSGESMRTKADVEFVVYDGEKGLRASAAMYCPERDLQTGPWSPLWTDLSGLCPILIQVGDEEILLDDATRLEAQIMEHGGPVELQVWPGMVHAWQLFAPLLPEATQAIEAVAAFFTEHLQPSGS